MPGLDPGIHHFKEGWIAGSSPAMTDSKTYGRFGSNRFSNPFQQSA